MPRSLTKKVLALTAASLMGVGLFAGCSTTDDGGGGGGGGGSANVPGVTDTAIELGNLLALTGPFAPGSKAQLAGATLYWDQVNAEGGVCDGRSVQLQARDHAYDPQKAVTQYSAIRNDVFAIQLLTGTAMTEAVSPQMEKDDVVSIPMSWSPDLLDKPSILIPGTTYDVDMINAVDYLLKEGTIKKGDNLAYMYFQGDFGGPGVEGAKYAAEKNGLTLNEYQVNPTSDLTSEINQIKAKGSAAIFMSVNPPLLAKAANLSASAGMTVPIVVPTPTFGPELLGTSAADNLAARVLVVSPYNAWSGESDGMKALRESYEKAGDTETPQQFYIAGYAAASLMHSALESTCKSGDLTRANLAKEFANIKSFEMDGLSVDLSYTDRSVPPALSDYILKVDKDAVGGLTPLMPEPFKGDDAKPLLTGK